MDLARRPDGKVRSTRLVSFSQRAMAAISYEVEPVDETIRIVVQSELVANEPQPGMHEDPACGRGARGPARGRVGASS